MLILLILDKFFLKYKGVKGGGGVGQTDPPLPQKELPSKSLALSGLSKFELLSCLCCRNKY